VTATQRRWKHDRRREETGDHARLVPIVAAVAQQDTIDAILAEIGTTYTILLRIAHELAGDEAMTGTQRLALIEIVAGEPLRLRDLAARMSTTPATATRAVDALEELKFARRKRDPDDRRGVLVVATTRGRRWSDDRRAGFVEVLKRLPPDAVTPEAVASLGRLNDALADAAKLQVERPSLPH
jgi:DNA-binding MarR family transcriptional regulator